jgi:hypothetical protein
VRSIVDTAKYLYVYRVCALPRDVEDGLSRGENETPAVLTAIAENGMKLGPPLNLH